MDDDIGSGLLSMAVCFDFRSTNVVQLSKRNPYFYWFRCHHPLITQLILNNIVLKVCDMLRTGTWELERQPPINVTSNTGITVIF